MRYIKLIIFMAIAVVFVGVAIYMSFVHPPRCQTFECYEEHMSQCKAAQYLNDGEDATWRYRIMGLRGGACVVEVTLLQAKKGELNMNGIAGYSMECGFPVGVVAYPDKDLGSCTGKLKEEIQELTIKYLHQYILENIQEIDETLQLLIEEST